MTIDLSTLETGGETSILHVYHPVTEEPLGATIELAGQDSERYRKAQLKIQRRFLNGFRPGKKNKESDDALELLIAATVSWTGIQLDGRERPCDAENAREVYTRLGWLREQASAHVHDRENFFRGNSGGAGGAAEARAEAGLAD